MKYSNLKTRKLSKNQISVFPNVFLTNLQLKFKRDQGSLTQQLISPVKDASFSLLSDSLLTSPLSNQSSFIPMSLKLSESILKNPKAITDNNTKLSLVEKQINQIDNLQSTKLMGLQTLYLSNNYLKSLDNIQQFSNLRNLSLSFNNISRLCEINKLSSLDNLESLRLEGNPITNLYPNFRKIVIYLLPQLSNLDGVQITEAERKESEVVYQKQKSLMKMLYDNEYLLAYLQNALQKYRIHQHMQALGYVIQNSMNYFDLEKISSSQGIFKLDLIQNLAKYTASQDDQQDIDNWFELTYLQAMQNKSSNIFDTFVNHNMLSLKKQDSKQTSGQPNWDAIFSDSIVYQQQQIAQLIQQLNTLVKSIYQQHQRHSSTPRGVNGGSNQSNQLFGIQSPRIIENSKSPNKNMSSSKIQMVVSIEGRNALQQNQIVQNQGQSQVKNKNNTSTGSKKRKKKSAHAHDIKQMNLTKILETKENSIPDINLLDQTFSGLLLNESNNFEPVIISSAHVNTISPNSIINNKQPKQELPTASSSITQSTQQKPITTDIQFSLQMLERLEQLEKSVQAKDQHNEQLQDKNKKLIHKIKEFQEQNRLNVEQATQQIINLQRMLKDTQENNLSTLQQQESLQQHLQFLEDENRILNQRLSEIEEKEKQMADYHQQLNDGIYEQGKIEVAVNMHEFQLKRKWFLELRRSSRIYHKLEKYRETKRIKRARYLKLLCFLYFRQETALKKHIKQLQFQKEMNLKYAIVYTFYQHKKQMQKLSYFHQKKGMKLLAFYFKTLYIFRKIQIQKRIQKQNALQVRALLLKNKVVKSLKINLRQHQMPFNPQTLQYYNKLIRSHRKHQYFQHMKKVCFTLLPLQRLRNERARNKYNRTLVSQCFNLVFKRLMKYKKSLKGKVKHLRIQHARSLQIKAFSTLLFNKIQMQRKKPLIQMQQNYTKQRCVNKWVQAFFHIQTIKSKLKFFKLRWLVLKKKRIIRAFKDTTVKLHQRDKAYSMLRIKEKRNIYREVVKKWIMKLREELLDQRRIKYQCFKVLKIFLKKRRQINQRSQRILAKIKNQQKGKLFGMLQQNAIQKRSNHTQRVIKGIFYRMISLAFTSSTHKQRQEINDLKEKLQPLEQSYEDKQQQINFFITKCCDLENDNQSLTLEVQSLQSKYIELKDRTIEELTQVQLSIDEQASQNQALEEQKQALETKVKELQESQLKKLEEFKEKFQKSDTEIQRLRKQLIDKDSLKKTQEEQQNNIKLLHQLKKAHKTIEEMRGVIENADVQLNKYKKEVDQLRREKDQEREEIINKHIVDIKEITFMVEKIKRENMDLKKEVNYLNEKIIAINKQQNKRVYTIYIYQPIVTKYFLLHKQIQKLYYSYKGLLLILI